MRREGGRKKKGTDSVEGEVSPRSLSLYIKLPWEPLHR